MEKNFKKWHAVKESVNNLDSRSLYFREKEIWWCYVGANFGFEQDGKGGLFMRPVLILKKFSRNLCWVLPLSTKVSRGDFFFPLLSESNTIRMTTLPQMRLVDSRRLINKIDRISTLGHSFIKEKIIAFIR